MRRRTHPRTEFAATDPLILAALFALLVRDRAIQGNLFEEPKGENRCS